MIIDWLVQPLSLVCLLLLTASIYSLWRGVRGLALVNTFSLVILWGLSTPELSNRWVQRLESTRQNPEKCDTAEVRSVVVLGGGMNPWIPNSYPASRLNRDSAARVNAAAQIGGAETHWFTHGAGANSYTLADDMATLLIAHGIDDEAITRERTSTTTFENANNLIQLLPPTNNTTIHLVTSAMHVSRAASIFSNAGYQVCHVPNVDSRYSVPALPTSLLPYLGGLEKSTLAWREQLARVKQAIQERGGS